MRSSTADIEGAEARSPATLGVVSAVLSPLQPPDNLIHIMDLGGEVLVGDLRPTAADARFRQNEGCFHSCVRYPTLAL